MQLYRVMPRSCCPRQGGAVRGLRGARYAPPPPQPPRPPTPCRASAPNNKQPRSTRGRGQACRRRGHARPAQGMMALAARTRRQGQRADPQAGLRGLRQCGGLAWSWPSRVLARTHRADAPLGQLGHAWGSRLAGRSGVTAALFRRREARPRRAQLAQLALLWGSRALGSRLAHAHALTAADAPASAVLVFWRGVLLCGGTRTDGLADQTGPDRSTA